MELTWHVELDRFIRCLDDVSMDFIGPFDPGKVRFVHKPMVTCFDWLDGPRHSGGPIRGRTRGYIKDEV